LWLYSGVMKANANADSRLIGKYVQKHLVMMLAKLVGPSVAPRMRLDGYPIVVVESLRWQPPHLPSHHVDRRLVSTSTLFVVGCRILAIFSICNVRL
jgi:hypothetical protein